jgi:hypothetical protein
MIKTYRIKGKKNHSSLKLNNQEGEVDNEKLKLRTNRKN